MQTDPLPGSHSGWGSAEECQYRWGERRSTDASASLPIWWCKGIRQFTLIRGTDPWHEVSHGAHASRFHHGPFPMHPRRLNRIEPGTCTREAADHHATAPVLFGLTIVALDPGLPRLADGPGGLVPAAPECPCAGGGHVGGKPGQPGPGDRADGTPVDNASPPGGGRGHRAPITGHGVACRVLGRHGVFHQADRRAVAPRRPLGRGLTTPPDVLFNAQGAVRRVGGDPEQPIAWRVLHASAGSGLTIPGVARVQVMSTRTMASSLMGHERVVGLRPGS